MRLDHQLGVVGARIGRLVHGGVTWIAVERAGPDELEVLAQTTGLSPAALAERGQPGGLPRVEHLPRCDLALLHFPVLLARPRRLAAGELRLAVGADFVLTAHDGTLRPLVALFDELQASQAEREGLSGGPPALAQLIVRTLLLATAGWSERAGAALDQLQGAVLGRSAVDAPRQLLGLRRELVDLREILGPLPGLIEQLGAGPLAGSAGGPASWRDVADLAERQLRQLRGVDSQVEAVDRALDQRLAEQRNTLLRTIATTLALGLPPLVVAALYGSGLRGVPGAETEWAFEIALALALAAATASVAVLRRRRWL